MDSNRQYIKHDKFWNGHSCKIMRAGDVNAGKNFGLQLSIPIFNGMNNNANIKKSKLQGLYIIRV